MHDEVRGVGWEQEGGEEAEWREKSEGGAGTVSGLRGGMEGVATCRKKASELCSGGVEMGRRSGRRRKG